jgi:ParB family transcriptional regulator, chromosome partitioning protein
VLEIQYVTLAELKPWEDNPRLNDQAVDAVAKSIELFGFNVPILCDQHLRVIAGHTRLKAAAKLEMGSVPAILLPLTDAQRRAFSVADNKTGEIADWEFPGLREVLEQLGTDGIDLRSLGYCDEELRALLEEVQDLDWDAFDELTALSQSATHVLMPVRVPVGCRDNAKTAIQRYATEHGLSGSDQGILAGDVVLSLLGVTT